MLERIDFCWNAQVSEVLTATIHIVHVPPTLNTQATIGRTLEATIGRARRAREGDGYGSVPPRKTHHTLNRWLHRQQQAYEKMKKGEKVAMNEERATQLRKLGFLPNE
jgi:hypothetical protein